MCDSSVLKIRIMFYSFTKDHTKWFLNVLDTELNVNVFFIILLRKQHAEYIEEKKNSLIVRAKGFLS